MGRKAELGYRKIVEGKGKNQKRIKGEKERDKVRRCPGLLKSSAKLNFLGRSNSSASPKSFRKWGSKLICPLFLHHGTTKLAKDGAVA